MHYEGNIIRPPSESDSILLQVTVGCAHNKCTFCGAYAGERFKIKSDDLIFSDLEYAAQHFKQQTRVFLCDGDVMGIPYKRLLKIFLTIEELLPWVNMIATFASARSVNRRTDEEIQELKDHGLAMIYMGLESGDNDTLEKVKKGITVEKIIEAGRKIKTAEIQLAITTMLGIGGRERSQIHARETGRAISAIEPDIVGAMSLMLMTGTPMHKDNLNGKFPLLEPVEMLEELKTMLYHTNLSHGLFSAAHASNYLSINAWMPEDKQVALDVIDEAIKGNVSLKPESMRAF